MLKRGCAVLVGALLLIEGSLAAAWAQDADPVAPAAPTESDGDWLALEDGPDEPVDRATEGAGSGSTGGSAPAEAARRRPLPPGTIGFGNLPVGTQVRRQYMSRGIVFGGQSPFVATDGSNPGSPVLAGTPRYFGNIRAWFVRPGTLRPRTVNTFALNVGYINDPGHVRIIVFGLRGQRLGTFIPRRRGIVRIRSQIRGAHSFLVRIGPGEEAGVAIDNLVFPGINYSTGNLLANPSFEQGTSNTGWKAISFTGNVSHQNRTGVAAHGLRFARVRFTRNGASFGQDLAFRPRKGDLVKVKVRFRNRVCSSSAPLTLAVWARGSAQHNASRDVRVACRAWRLKTMNFRVRSDNTSLRLEIYSGFSGRRIDIDHAALWVIRSR